MRKLLLTTLVPLLLVVLLTTPAMGESESFDGSMAIPMILFTGAGLAGSGNSTGLVASFGESGETLYQSFGYDFVRPWDLWGRDTRVQAVWLAPLDWWEADAFSMGEEPYPALGLQLNHTLFKTHLIPGAPGGGGNPPRLPTTIGLSLGTTFDLEHEEIRLHVGLNLFRFLF